MAYYAPLQRKDGRWDYTCTNGAGTFSLGYCSGYRELTVEDLRGAFTPEMVARENDRHRPFKDKYHDSGHATADEAMACYRTYQLDQQLEFSPNDDGDEQRKCQVCGTWTTGIAFFRGEMYKVFHLCKDHQSRKFVEEVWDAKKV